MQPIAEPSGEIPPVSVKTSWASEVPWTKIVVGLLVAGALAAAYLAYSGDSQYEGSLSGAFPKTQYVGTPESLDLQIVNTGSKTMPNVTIDLENNDPWVVQSAEPDGKSLGDAVFSFGPLAPRGELAITLTLVPREAGNVTIDMYAYGDVDDGSNAGLQSLGDGLIGALTQNVAVLP